MMYLLIVVNNIKCTNPNNGSHNSQNNLYFNANETRTQGDEMDEEMKNEAELKKIMSQYGLKYTETSEESHSAHKCTFIVNKTVGPTQYNQSEAPEKLVKPRLPEMPRMSSCSSQSNSIISENSNITTNENHADPKNDTTSEKQIHQDASKCEPEPEIVSDGFTSKNGNVYIDNLHSKKNSKTNGGTCSITTDLKDVIVSSNNGKVRIGYIGNN